MKYFLNADERKASGHKHYIEFQPCTATEEFWDERSIYMAESTMADTQFEDFWCGCMHKGLVFDMDAVFENEFDAMEKEVAEASETALEILKELRAWAEPTMQEDKQYISVIRECDRAWARRRKQLDRRHQFLGKAASFGSALAHVISGLLGRK